MNRRRGTKIIGLSIIAMMMLAVVYQVSMTATTIVSRGLEHHRLSRLEYPEPSEKAAIYLTFKDHLGGTNIHTNWIEFGPFTDNNNHELGKVMFRVGTRIEGNIRIESSRTVSMTAATTGSLRLPVTNWVQSPLKLIAQSTLEVHTTTFSMGLASQFKAPHHTDAMEFHVPTLFFVEAINQDTLRAQIGTHEVRFTEEDLQVLRELAAYLKPGVSP
ncbi:MAG: hypothetical protein JKY96_08840 [Phycisphaerales bacterium]|nr:hypothetical protein [Phycisphaerales bacterium]